MTATAIIPPFIRDTRGKAFGAAMDHLDQVPSSLAYIMDIDALPAAALEAMADQFGIGGPLWKVQATDAARRALLKVALLCWINSGTKSGLVRVLGLMGFPGGTILDRMDALIHNATFNHDGSRDYGSALAGWWLYVAKLPLALNQGYTLATHLDVLGALEQFAPVRSVLDRVTLQLAPSSTGGGSPSGVVDVAISPDGAVWTPGHIFSAVLGANSGTIRAKFFKSDATGMDVAYLGLRLSGGSVFKQVTVTPIHKDALVELEVAWTLTW